MDYEPVTRRSDLILAALCLVVFCAVALVSTLERALAFAVASGVERSQAENARSAIASRLPILSPEQDEQLLRDAGFSGVSLFYAGFAFRGWVAYA